ncbi:hypothetical protein ACSAZK_08865 [Methanosarcina sp. Mfa9]|uniref:hypothetical protein n=1 Tax=Methanosarcina sp. Mfa9 TaxID=3439063 RepID=UPI003F86ABC1
MKGGNFLTDERAVNPGVIVAAGIIGIAVLAVLATAFMFGESTEKAVSSGRLIKIEVKVLDSNTLKLEHQGGDPLDFGEDTKFLLSREEVEYELSFPSEISQLEVGDSMELTLPEGAELKKGESALLKIRDVKKRKDIFRKEISFD